MEDKSGNPAIDPIYYTDDYEREGCRVTIKVGAEQCAMRVFAPGGEILECYNPPTADVPAMMEIWLSGKVPGKRAILALDRESHDKAG